MLLCPANDAGLAVAQEAPPPQWAIYMDFFGAVAFYESFGDRLKAMGKDDGRTRFTIKRESGLTDAEYALLKAAALESIRRQREARAEITRIRKSYPENDWLSGRVPKDVGLRVGQLFKAEMAVPDETAASLREKLGPERFNVLDRYIKTRKTHLGYSTK